MALRNQIFLIADILSHLFIAPGFMMIIFRKISRRDTRRDLGILHLFDQGPDLFFFLLNDPLIQVQTLLHIGDLLF